MIPKWIHPIDFYLRISISIKHVSDIATFLFVGSTGTAGVGFGPRLEVHLKTYTVEWRLEWISN